MKTMQTAPMTTLKQHIARLTIGLGLAATLALGAVMPTLAASEPVTGTAKVTGAPDVVFTVPSTLAMSLVALNDGTDKDSTGSLVIGVVDYRGNGNGWKLQISSTGFMRSGDVSPLAGFAVTSTDLIDNSVGESTAPDNTGTTLPTVSTTASTFYKAAANSGLGDFTITTGFTLPVPANTLAGDYSAAVTIDTSNAP